MSDFNINELMQQAKKMQEQMQKAQAQEADEETPAESQDGE